MVFNSTTVFIWWSGTFKQEQYSHLLVMKLSVPFFFLLLFDVCDVLLFYKNVELPFSHPGWHLWCWFSQSLLYRVSWGECARLWETVPHVKVHRSNPKHLYPKLNSYGDNGERKVWSSCGSTYCTFFVCCYPYTAHVRPSVSQPSQAHSAFIFNRCHSYSEL